MINERMMNNTRTYTNLSIATISKTFSLLSCSGVRRLPVSDGDDDDNDDVVLGSGVMMVVLMVILLVARTEEPKRRRAQSYECD